MPRDFFIRRDDLDVPEGRQHDDVKHDEYYLQQFQHLDFASLSTILLPPLGMISWSNITMIERSCAIKDMK